MNLGIGEALIALGFVFVIEGILPFISPSGYQKLMAALSKRPQRALRVTGLISMLVGLCIVTLVKKLGVF